MDPSPEELIIKHRIDELYTKYPFFGSRRIKEHLEAEMDSSSIEKLYSAI
jgi:putative transposase